MWGRGAGGEQKGRRNDPDGRRRASVQFPVLWQAIERYYTYSEGSAWQVDVD